MVRRCFQVTTAKAAELGVKSKAYLYFTEDTAPGTLPCGSAACWVKAPGVALASCGRDVCVFAAACTMHSELLDLRPDRRRRRGSEASEAEEELGEEGEEAQENGSLQTWKERWAPLVFRDYLRFACSL